ncbi:Ppx/GppA phosphatase family protein [Capnocytophaga sp. oral taxon 863 str. F0517]|uniref:Ppx/GppA phosphatase family protein n=1 Tax=Capnocytophaga sp. oral taxon 863 TaxID=1227265 RepID=UPI0003978DA2|nr:ethanolamine ammonia-lyase reactivating factor EutA [Capnocytophaga sp. oral taxon 863]ERI63796.1 Ppx/GppA phosphatase family protein [Capnocytophaga sp. oral taxon 863 str. F0517]
MNIRKFAGIDIGSNGVRLLIANVLEEEGKEPIFSKGSLVRVPIRLGADVFEQGKISPENTVRLKDAMEAYRLLMKVQGVEAYRACATSAMREATNGKEVVEEVAQQTGIFIEIIDGAEEAAIIANTDLHTLLEGDKNYLYIDVGGGSTEFTVYAQGEVRAARSFPIGGVRLLKGKADEQLWDKVKDWIRLYTKDLKDMEAIGSGGNINKISKSTGKRKDVPLTLHFLEEYLEQINQMTYEERIRDLELNPDRADILPLALPIYIKAMKWAKIKHILVPKVGLADGIVRQLYLNS